MARDDASYGPTVLSVAREYGIPVQALYRVPVSETRVGYWLNLLLEAMVEGFPFEATARFLAHPLGPGIPSGRWAKARRVRPNGAAAWEEVGIDLSSLAWPEEDTRAGWLNRFENLLRTYGVGSEGELLAAGGGGPVRREGRGGVAGRACGGTYLPRALRRGGGRGPARLPARRPTRRAKALPCTPRCPCTGRATATCSPWASPRAASHPPWQTTRR